jgi:predicted house-cleaning noncanonical NTP pyrophosphatase (MazG superfamily)
MQEFLHICERLTQYLTDEECEELACIMYVVRQRTVLPYDELDNVSASLAFAKLSSID